MGTRSSISIRNADGSYTGVYCHWDGYISHNGRILQQHYQDEAKIRRLISLGSISSLGEEIGQQHDFDNPPKGVCNFYGRDRSETDVAAVTQPTLASLLAQIGQEYNYVWENGSWRVSGYTTNNKFVSLKDELRRDAAEDEPASEDINVSGDDFAGLSFCGPASTALEVAQLLRPVVEVHGVPNYLSDFVFALEMACQEAGLLDENYDPVPAAV